MTRTTCLCRLSFEPLIPLKGEWESDLLCPATETACGLVMETESLFQPGDITQVLWVANQLELVRRARLKGRVVLFNGKVKNINQVIQYCAEKKAAAVLITRKQDQTLTDAAVPVFTMEPEMLGEVVRSGNQWTVSIEVLCPLPDHTTTDSVCSSLMDESKVEGKTLHVTDNGDISRLDHAMGASSVRAKKTSERLKVADEPRTSWCERRKHASIVLVTLCTSLAFHGVATILFRTFDKCGTNILQNGINLDLGDTKRAQWHNRSWTLESLYPSVHCDDNTSCPQLYASLEEEKDLRRWLNDHDLPQDVGNKLLYTGVRKINDLVLLFQSSTDNDTLNEIAALDVVKIKQALGMSSVHATALDSCAIDSDSKEGFKIMTIVGQILSGFVTVIGPLLDLLCVGMVILAVSQNWHSDKEFYGVFLLVSAIRSIWFTTFNSMSMLRVIISMTNDSATCDQHVFVCFLTQLVTTSGSLVLLGIFVSISANAG